MRNECLVFKVDIKDVLNDLYNYDSIIDCDVRKFMYNARKLAKEEEVEVVHFLTEIEIQAQRFKKIKQT